MKLVLGKEYYFNLILKPKKDNAHRLIVFVESRSGRLDTLTGEVLPLDELDNAVENAIEDVNGKDLDEIKGLAYLPHTLEVIATRLWERIDEALGYKARLAKLKLVRGDTFVEYIGREQDMGRETKTQPQTKLRKRK
jgi:hypothetical protein